MDTTTLSPVNVKACTKCSVAKPITEFYALMRGLSGVDSCCKECKLKYCRARTSETREARLRTMNIRRAKYTEQGLCTICGKPRSNNARLCDYHFQKEKVYGKQYRQSKYITRDSKAKECQGFIYIIKSGGIYFKIGQTVNVSKRLGHLRTATPLDIELIHSIGCLNMSMAEKHFHALFNAKRHRLEWFILDESDILWIKNIKYIGKTMP